MELLKRFARVWQSGPRPTPAQQRRVRLQVEGLEDRRVPSGSQMAPVLPQLAQAQQSQPSQGQACQGHWVYMVGYHQKNCAWHNRTFNNPQQANKFIQSIQCQGYTVKLSKLWVKSSPTPVNGPTIRV